MIWGSLGHARSCTSGEVVLYLLDGLRLDGSRDGGIGSCLYAGAIGFVVVRVRQPLKQGVRFGIGPCVVGLRRLEHFVAEQRAAQQKRNCNSSARGGIPITGFGSHELFDLANRR
jgi:hypothetical protein